MTKREARPDDRPLALLRPHWRLVLAAFLGWFLDAFDQTALVLVLPEIGKHFGASLTAMGLVITAQSLGRIAGNVGWGWLADRFGRKPAFMAGVLWFALFSGLSGLAWSYGALLVIQLLFGIGFGGEWTASAALLMESVPARARAVASSLMMAGYEVGFLAAAGMQALLVPRLGWRALFFVGIVPALLAILIRLGVAESPVWLKTHARGQTSATARPRLRPTAAALQACAFMAVLQFQTASIYDFYPTLLKTVAGIGPGGVFAGVAAYSIGSVLGKLASGAAATRLGDRPVILALLVVTMLSTVPFVTMFGAPALLLPAAIIGASSSGVFALVPHYLSLRFESGVRSFGMGLAYALAAGGQAVATYVLPATARGAGLPLAIALFVVASSLAVAAIAIREPRDLPGRDMDGIDARFNAEEPAPEPSAKAFVD